MLGGFCFLSADKFLGLAFLFLDTMLVFDHSWIRMAPRLFMDGKRSRMDV